MYFICMFSKIDIGQGDDHVSEVPFFVVPYNQTICLFWFNFFSFFFFPLFIYLFIIYCCYFCMVGSLRPKYEICINLSKFVGKFQGKETSPRK